MHLCLCTFLFLYRLSCSLADARQSYLMQMQRICCYAKKKCNPAENKANPSCGHTRHCSTGTSCQDTGTGRAPGSQWSQTTRHHRSLTETCHLWRHHITTENSAKKKMNVIYDIIYIWVKSHCKGKTDLCATAFFWRCQTAAATPRSRLHQACRGTCK